MSEADDLKNIKNALNGDENAISDLVKKYLKAIYNFVYKQIGDQAQAEELTQETFLKAWKKLKSFKQNENFKTWLFTIARHTTIDYFRKKKALSFSDLSEENEKMITEKLPDPNPLPDEILQKIEDKQILNKLLEKLPQNYKEILILHYIEDFDFDEIGKIQKKPLNTIRSQHHRALIKLRDLAKNSNFASENRQ